MIQYSLGISAVKAESMQPLVNAPEFPSDIPWLNTLKPLSISALKGRYVLLDFWTYACINCMHVVPDLEKLENEFSSQLTVIGVHSAKFQSEKDSRQITKAIERFGIHHPVVNDSDFRIWESYAVRAWPTVVLIDPNGKIILSRSGEGVYEALQPILSKVIKRDSEVPGVRNRNSVPPEALNFPGKLIVNSDKLYIADSGRNRIVIASLTGTILEIIGDDEVGNKDGGFKETRFNEPLGLAIQDQNLFVADRKNHSIRVCDLNRKRCETFVGSGKQGKEFNLSGTGSAVDLNSPWDLLVDGNSLYVAMAGFHQIWKVDLATRFAEPFSGTGGEAITDGPINNLESGGTHAQPSGLTGGNGKFYVADSESSSIRVIENSKISTLIGTGLFKFGDKDGAFETVKLQHPLGVLAQGDKLFVADTLNSKIKLITLSKRRIETFSGGPTPGYKEGRDALFDEPSGLAVSGNQLFVADTNNSAIRVIDLLSKEVSTLKLSISQNERKDFGKLQGWASPETRKIQVIFKIPSGHSFNAEAPNQIRNERNEIIRITTPGGVPVDAGSYEGEIYYCEDATNICLIEKIKFGLSEKEEAPKTVIISLDVDSIPK